MAVLAEFQPTQAPGANARGFLGAYGQMSSLMERKQRLAMDQENQEMERAKFQAFMPAIVAKQKADMVSAAASIANAARMEELRAKAAAESADYNDRFLNIMTIPDQKDRSDTLGVFMGEIAWLDNPALPEFQPFAKAVKEERAKAFIDYDTNRKLAERTEQNEATVEGRKYVAETQAAGRVETAGIRANTQLKLKQIDADTKLGIEDKRAQRTAVQLQALQQQAAEADQDAADAARDGNTQLAATYRQNAANFRDAIEKTTTFAGTGQSAPRTAAQDPRPTPKQETQYPKITMPSLGSSSRTPEAPTKLYQVDPETKAPAFSPSVRTPTEMLGAVQQMVDDKVIGPEEARAMLLRLGFRPKK